MDEVIVSTSFNKLQSQNVMKVEHQSMKSLQQKGAVTLIEGLETLPGISQISTVCTFQVIHYFIFTHHIASCVYTHPYHKYFYVEDRFHHIHLN